MDEAKLQEIEARANAATPGPWEPEHRGVVGNDVFIVEDCVTAGWDAYRANQAFIATARTDVPDLVAEVRRLTAALATVTAEHAAALDAARREGAEGMQQRCEETCASIASAHAERFVLKTAGGAIYAAREYGAAKCGAECVDAIRALPLDAPGGAPDCTGVTAQWCPRCGDCACPLLHEGNVEGGRTLNDPKCPLHAPSSPHGDAPGGAS